MEQEMQFSLGGINKVYCIVLYCIVSQYGWFQVHDQGLAESKQTPAIQMDGWWQISSER